MINAPHPGTRGHDNGRTEKGTARLLRFCILTPRTQTGFDITMSLRLVACLVVSVLVHVAILIQPIMIMAKQAFQERPYVPVRLVNLPQELLEPLGELAEIDQPPVPEEEEDSEGVRFVAEGGVAPGYLDRLKIKIFRIWEYPEDAIFRGEQGRVSIGFVLNAMGEVIDIGVETSSGSDSLDAAAMSAIEKAAPFGPLVDSAPDRKLKVTGHFAYVLD